jgi:hypothetical protein
LNFLAVQESRILQQAMTSLNRNTQASRSPEEA